MPTKNPRLNVVLEPPVYLSIKKLAEKNGVSLSLEARDLIREALGIYEDKYWLERVEEREKTFDRSRVQTHNQVWK
ncbi:MAG: antitoxin, RHH family protein [bacterium (Candidatus Ratteibacteria) CG_4_10_14_3_um_filter_41_18]|uniref:Antitoxin, RHH family protein n=3 Tax=Candidatus Ratteibacteria TaxID=2979319 RepID=A0A2M7E7I8_9BACT|nr:MAG: antitoxin, RHH family protein [bacterium (Candidatus Ratteibacteria) CG01_land_8_20_14_3_00_40_19]PIW32572.1 MAG: antitoxin, RHH family protein [bacterium (Candidatus Ratteibacteria) CG15_BIG_FIL_POST_REV_8_21_14_020_41_12]PIX77298.1 MAG: antitoxin, RHH family protein [bacterium (Candidatus Ratteibacteria) CG_4_10_14_3_um_filter_41_18]HCG76960.1 antitoxin, RHH family protein [bacterium]